MAKHLVLAPILALALYVAFVPHQNYVYPVHLDEWQVMAYTNQLVLQGNLSHLTNPVYGGTGLFSNQIGEIGTHVFWGAFREVTGLDWLIIFQYFPGVLLMITVLGVFVLGQRQGFGWQAALFASLVPTTVGILGPAFLVPIALALPLIVLALFLAFNVHNWWCYPALSLLMVGTAAVHPPTAAILLLVLLPCIIVSLKGQPRHAAFMALAIVAPFVVLFPAIYHIAVPMVARLFVPQQLSPYADVPALVTTLGYLPVLLCLLGVVYLLWRRRQADYALVGGAAILLVVLAVYFSLHYGEGIIYYRGLLVAMLLVCTLAGAGLAAVGELRLPQWTARWLRPPLPAGAAAMTVLVAATLLTTIPTRLSTPYYHMLDATDYRAFTWIRDNVPEEYNKGLVDPWQGMAFVGVSGREVFSYVGETPDANAAAAVDFLKSGGSDIAVLKNNGISIVYSHDECTSPDLVEVHDGVYLVRGD